MEQISMFDVMEEREHTAPLASRLRPETLDEFAGQKQLVGEGAVLRRLIDRDQIPSMIFWASRRGKNYAGQHHCQDDPCGIY